MSRSVHVVKFGIVRTQPLLCRSCIGSFCLFVKSPSVRVIDIITDWKFHWFSRLWPQKQDQKPSLFAAYQWHWSQGNVQMRRVRNTWVCSFHNVPWCQRDVGRLQLPCIHYYYYYYYYYYINQPMHWTKYIHALLQNPYMFRHRSAIIRQQFSTNACRPNTQI
jgi:hypothetical protein